MYAKYKIWVNIEVTGKSIAQHLFNDVIKYYKRHIMNSGLSSQILVNSVNSIKMKAQVVGLAFLAMVAFAAGQTLVVNPTTAQKESCAESTDPYNLAPYPCDATKFLMCSTDKVPLYMNSCPAGLTYNGKVGYCDGPEVEKAAPPCSSPGGLQLPPEPEVPETCEGIDNGFIPVNGTCKKYYHCVRGEPYERPCPWGEYFLMDSPHFNPRCTSYFLFVTYLNYTAALEACRQLDPWLPLTTTAQPPQ